MREKQDTRLVRRLFLQLLPVQAFAAGLPAINSLLDGLIVGNLIGPSALAAIGFTDPMIMFLSAVSSTLAAGSQLLCGKHLGKADKDGIAKVFSTTVAACCAVGLFFTLVIFALSTPVAQILGAQGQSLSDTAAYVRGLSIGTGCSILLACLLPFLQLDRAEKRSNIAVAAMVTVNIVGNFLNGLVLHGGLLGVGLSTALANIIAVLIVLPHFVKKSTIFRFSFRSIHMPTLKTVLYLGFPNAIRPACLVFRNRVVNHYMFQLGGVVGMSAMALANNITTAIGCVIESGYTGSARLIGSVLVGQRDSSSLRGLPGTMARCGLPIYGIAYAIVFFFAKPLALLFGAEAEHLALYVMVIRFFNVWYLTNIIQAPPTCLYQTMGEVKLMTVFTILSTFVYPITSCVLLSHVFGVYAVASTTWIPEVLMLITYAVYFTYKAKRLPRSITELTYIPSSISAPRENRFRATIRTQEDAIATSQDAIRFCLGKGMPTRTANYCGLCIEEMAMDTILNRFDQKERTIDLRIIYEDGKMRILFRDDCPQFDPTKWLELCTPEDISRSIGIRMVSKLSKEMNYSCTLGLNVLTISI